MPYVDIGSHFTNDYNNQGWQIKIALDSSAIKLNHPDNKINTIKKILAKYQTEHEEDLKIKMWAITNEDDLYDNYDGTISRQGKDKTYRGSEICIDIANTEDALSSREYKTLLLNLWHDLQQANIPLQYLNTPGDRKIVGPQGLPSPFVITSYDNRRPGEEEWKDKHGVLFKEFKGWDKRHPILKVRFEEKELKQHKIAFTPLQIAKINRDNFLEHQHLALIMLRDDIIHIKDEDQAYRQILFDDTLNDYLKEKINIHHSNMERLDPEAQAEYHEDWIKELDTDPRLQDFLNNYPHEDDANFSSHVIIKHLRDLRGVNANEIDGLLKQLRTSYDELVSAINVTYNYQTIANDKSLPEMRVNWSRYIPNYTEELFTELLEKNPVAMQVIYRRVMLLEQETRLHEGFKQQWLQTYYHDKHIYEQLNGFHKQIEKMAKQTDKSDDRAVAVVKSFKALHDKIEDELFKHPATDLQDTPYPSVLNHFKQLAQKITKGSAITMSDLSTHHRQLDRKLATKKPMSKSMKAAICSAIGAVVGATLGFVVGAAITFWSGSFGALPGAIAGGILGMTMAEGLVVGSAAAGTALATSATCASVGFFSARARNKLYEQKEKDKRAYASDVSNIYDSIAIRYSK